MQQRKMMIHRRHLMHAVGAAVAVAGGTSLAPATAAAPDTKFGKRKAQYQPNSDEVRNFYRVNRYPAN